MPKHGRTPQVFDKKSILDNIIVDPETGCWVWQKALTDGKWRYGVLKRSQVQRRAHRVSFALWNDIPVDDEGLKELFICHRCDNPPCCNPAHLFAGTPEDNMKDALAKERLRMGERSHYAKLTLEQVLEIRESDETHEALGHKYGVSRECIGRVLRNQSWAHVKGR